LLHWDLLSYFFLACDGVNMYQSLDLF
jgi:hypothetical protein